MAETDKQGDTQKEVGAAVTVPKSKHDDATALLFRSGGAYIPPAKLRKLQAQITDKSSAAYQRLSWEALKKSLNGAVNKANVSNLSNVIRELLHENVIRGRGLLVRSIIKAQSVSPTFAHVYAAMIAVVNTKFPQIGDLLLRRLIMTFKRSFRRNQKDACVSSLRFIAHLINQNVVHEVLALEVCLLLLLQPTDDSVECVVSFLKECGAKLQDVSPSALHSVFERLRDVLHEASLDIRVQYAVEVLFQIRKDGYKEHLSVLPELNLVEEDDQNTHTLRLDDTYTTEDQLDVFKPDPSFEENEAKYAAIRDEILGEGDSESGSDAGDADSADAESDEEEKQQEKAQLIVDRTETDLVELRKTIYLTIQSSLDFQECVHKLMKLKIEENQQGEMCSMVLDCCAQLRTYEKFYGLVAQRFCTLNKRFVNHFERLFVEQYSTCHRLETIKLRNVARFFAHLLHTDAIAWTVLRCVRLTEEDSTSSSRIFLKILFQELAEFLGLAGLHTRLNDPTLAEAVAGVFPRDSPKNTRFAINFLTCVGLGGLTDELREFLRTAFSKPNNDDEQLGEELNRADDEAAPGNEKHRLVDQLNAMLAEEQARHGLQKPTDEVDKPKAKRRDRKRTHSASQSSTFTSSSYSASVADSYSSSESDYEAKRRDKKKKKKHASRDKNKKQKKRKRSASQSRSRSSEDERRHKKKRKHERYAETGVDRSEKRRKSKRSSSDDLTNSNERKKPLRKDDKYRDELAEATKQRQRHDQSKEKSKRRELTASISRSRSRSRSKSPVRDKSKKEKLKGNEERSRRMSSSRSRSPSPIREKGKKEKLKGDKERSRRTSSRSRSPSPIREKGKKKKSKGNEERSRRMSPSRSRSPSPSPIREKGKKEKLKGDKERSRRTSSKSRSPSPIREKSKKEKSKGGKERSRRMSTSRSRSRSPIREKSKKEKSKGNEERNRRISSSRSRSPSPIREKGKKEKSKGNDERSRRMSSSRSRSPSPIRDNRKKELIKVKGNGDRNRRASYSRSLSASPARETSKMNKKDSGERKRRVSASRSRSPTPKRLERKQEEKSPKLPARERERERERHRSRS